MAPRRTDETVPTQKKKNPAKRTSKSPDNGPPTKAVKRRTSTTPPVNINAWPPEFRRLRIVLSLLNRIYTFLSSRKHVITTFEVLKSAVDKHFKSSEDFLTLNDVAKLKYLLPEEVVFEYMDENQVAINELVYVSTKGFIPSVNNDQFKLKSSSEDNQNTEKQLLMVQFLDGDPAKDRKNKPKPRYLGEMTVPKFSEASIIKLIEKRDSKIQAAIQKFLDSYSEKNSSPFEYLTAEAELLVPRLKQLQDPVEQMMNSGTLTVSPGETVSIPQFLETLRHTDFYEHQIPENGYFQIPGRDSVSCDMPFQLHADIRQALVSVKGITTLYSHQAEAISAVLNGRSVIISTSTSSGKSLIYQLPVLQSLLDDPNATSMFIFPTKALAQDQKRSLQELLLSIPGTAGILADTFDGDTPADVRPKIRAQANVIFTNPDMLHCSLLPDHRRWTPFLRSLKYVVLDELHMYDGFFGSNVALVMRRLRRLCYLVGNETVQFLSCSATIRNPAEHMERMFGISDVVHVSQDGSPCGTKHLVVWQPPYAVPKDPSSGRKNFIGQAAALLIELIKNNVRTIAFCKVRRVCELLMKEVRTRLEAMNRPEIVSWIMSYRGGYSVADRRRIEQQMFHGGLKGIVATTSLELGIDIGSLDAVLVVGFPRTQASFLQQSGRAGRRNHDSLTVFVGSADPVDSHYLCHPELLLKPPEQELVLTFDNILVTEGHIQCAAHEWPVELKRDSRFFPAEILAQVCAERLQPDPDGVHFHPADSFLPYPASHTSLRSIEDDMFAVVDITNNRNVVVETVEASRTSFTLYEGGIFLHQGYPYLVVEFNFEGKYAKIRRVEVDWITRQRDFTNIDPLGTEKSRQIASSVDVLFGKVEVTTVVFGFFKIDRKERILEAVEVDNPPIITHRKGFWVNIPGEALDIIKEKNLSAPGGIHAAQHILISMLPVCFSTENDALRTECKAPEKEFAKRQTARLRPGRLIFYDAVGSTQGSGVSARVYAHLESLLQRAIDRLEACSCDIGCPECVALPLCKEDNLVLSKPAARVILYAVSGRLGELPLSEIPDGPEPHMPQTGIQTIVPVVGTVSRAQSVDGVTPDERSSCEVEAKKPES